MKTWSFSSFSLSGYQLAFIKSSGLNSELFFQYSSECDFQHVQISKVIQESISRSAPFQKASAGWCECLFWRGAPGTRRSAAPTTLARKLQQKQEAERNRPFRGCEDAAASSAAAAGVMCSKQWEIADRPRCFQYLLVRTRCWWSGVNPARLQQPCIECLRPLCFFPALSPNLMKKSTSFNKCCFHPKLGYFPYLPCF